MAKRKTKVNLTRAVPLVPKEIRFGVTFDDGTALDYVLTGVVSWEFNLERDLADGNPLLDRVVLSPTTRAELHLKALDVKETVIRCR